MRGFIVVFLAAVIAAIAPAPAFSQMTYFPEFVEFNTLGGGARAAGMGGAFLGIADGEMAYSWNPSGMIFMGKPGIGLQLVSAADKFVVPAVVYSDSLRQWSANPTTVNRKHFNLNYAGVGVPFSFMGREWAVGGGYRNVYDMRLKYTSVGFFNSKDNFIQSDGVGAVSIAVAGKIAEGVALGVTANDYIRGTETNLWLGKYIPYGDPVPDTLDLWINDNSHYSGVNFDVGAMGEFSIVKASAVIHTPYKLKEKTLLTMSVMTPPRPVGIVDRVTYTTHMPLGFSFGLSVKPVENLIVAADFDSRPMSKVKIDVDWEPRTIPDTVGANPEWKDLNQFRVGAEYTFKAGFAEVPLRVGFRNSPSVGREVTKDDFGEITYGKQINPLIMTFGTGVRFEKAWVDLAYQFGSKSYITTIDYGTPEQFNSKFDYSRFFISAGMNF